MAGVQQRLKLKQTPIDTWSLREHLILASAVLRYEYAQIKVRRNVSKTTLLLTVSISDQEIKTG